MKIASKIDHTNLKPYATPDDIRKLCEEAMEHGFRGVCVNPVNLLTVLNALGSNMDIKIVTVAGFPLGAIPLDNKIREVDLAIENGADEVDVVWDIGAFKAGHYLKSLIELRKIVEFAEERDPKAKIKIIVETCYLDHDEQGKAFKIVHDSGAFCIKTSTGFGPAGASLAAIVLWNQLRKDHKSHLKIKAAGGIDTRRIAHDLICGGADILGTSRGVKIVKDEPQITHFNPGEN